MSGEAHATYPGLKVVDITTTIAGPLSTMILADLGADVTKVERPGRGDDARQFVPQWDGVGTVFLAYNRGKRSIVADIKSDAGKEVVRRLIDEADVVVESFRPGVMERLGFGYEEVSKRNPQLIYCSISAFGRGPLGRELPGYDPVIQAFSGIMAGTGHPGQDPVRVVASLVDITTGTWGAMNILAALARRERTGHGERIENTLVDSGYMLMSAQILGALRTGKSPQPAGSRFESSAPYEAFRVADGWVMIAAGNDPLFTQLCETLAIPEVANDARFVSVGDRVANRDALHALLERELLRLTASEAEALLQRAGVPISPINELTQTLAHPITAERDVLGSVSDDADDLRRAVRIPIAKRGEGSVPSRWAPRLGEHTEEILRELGLDATPETAGDAL